jgi:hypothetical protein
MIARMAAAPNQIESPKKIVRHGIVVMKPK